MSPAESRAEARLRRGQACHTPVVRWLGVALWLVTSTATAQDVTDVTDVTTLEAEARAADGARDTARGDDQVAAAERAIAAWQRVVDALVASGALVPRVDPPEATGDPPRIDAIPLPAALAGLLTARGRYIALPGREPERAAEHELENARVLYGWGHAELAREVLWRIYLELCREDPERSRHAWVLSYRLAVRLGDVPRAASLARHDSLARCGMSEPSDELQHLARQPLGGGANRTLLLYRRAEAAREAGRVDEAVRLFDEAASRLIEAVDGAPDDPEAPRALLLAGQALLGASHPDAAARAFARARDLVESLPVDLVSDHLLAVALFQLGEASRLADDAAAALAAWSRLTDEERFARSADPEVQLIVQDAAARLPVVTAR